MLAFRFLSAALARHAAATAALIVGVGLNPGAAFAASTTPYSIGSSTFVDLGPAPAVVEASNGPIDVVVADAQPSVPTVGHWLGVNTPFVAPAADPASHVWAVAYCCSSVAIVSVTPISNSTGGTSNAAAGSYLDGWNVTEGTKADAANAATDTTPISEMSALKQISKSNQAVAAALAGPLPSSAAAGSYLDGWSATLGTKADAASAVTDTTPISEMSALKQISKSIQAAVAALGSPMQQSGGTVAAAGSAGADYSANQPTLPVVGANFAASGPYASYVLIATVPASATRRNVDVENNSGAQIAIVRDDGTAAASAAPVNASVFALSGGAILGAQGGAWSSTTFKGRLQIYAPSATAQIAAMVE
jgi:hypothetical protein